MASGIGFLGAGVILREGSAVRGLTTAASIWLAASIGVLASTQLFIAAAGVAVIGYVTLEKLKGTPREVYHDDEERPAGAQRERRGRATTVARAPE